MRSVAIVLAMFLTLLPGSAGGDELTEAEQRGKAIYLTGQAPGSEEIAAFMGEAGLEVPASALPCANCHGRDGRGVPEGGVSPSNLTWDALTTPYGVRHESGREHPPYSDRSLLRAITMGLDPAGNELHLAMPRYRLTRADADALIAYLKHLGRESEPGLTERALTIATIVPVGEGAVGDGRAALAMMRAYFRDLNARGGVYGRTIELEVLEIAPTLEPSAAESRLVEFFDETSPFAVVYPYIAGFEEQAIALAERRELPLVGPVTLRPKSGFPVDRYLFYTSPGPAEEARALAAELADTVVARPGASATESLNWGMVGPKGETGPVTDTLAALNAEARRRKLPEGQLVEITPGAIDPEKVVKALRQHGATALVVATNPEDSGRFFEHLLTTDWTPDLFLPISLVGKGLAALQRGEVAYGGRVHVALPGLPGMAGVEPENRERIQQMYETHGLPPGHPATQRAVMSAADLLIEGLRRAGRGVTRETLVDQLEDLYEFETGYSPPMTFGPNRRIGAFGAYLLVLEPGSGEEGRLRWVDLDPTP